MKKQDIEFIKKSNNFIVLKDDMKKVFVNWADAVNYYNENMHNYKEIELIAICGFVAKTIAYKFKQIIKENNNENRL